MSIVTDYICISNTKHTRKLTNPETKIRISPKVGGSDEICLRSSAILFLTDS